MENKMPNYRSAAWMAKIRAMRGKKTAKRSAANGPPLSVKKSKKSKSRVTKMTRKRGYRRRGSGGFPIKKAAVGVLAGMAFGSGIMSYGAGYLLGGIPGVVGAFLAPTIAGMVGGAGTTGTTVKVYGA